MGDLTQIRWRRASALKSMTLRSDRTDFLWRRASGGPDRM